MKYYHVIYNSSQKGLNGSNGFGIRTATESTPRDYLDAVVKGVADNKFANVVTNCNVPTPQELMENNGQAIRRVPPRYFFQTLDVIGGRKIYTIGRNIYVGFTETFYYRDKEGNIMGKSGRMGTYLIDIYLFEECPPREVFDILYEQPAKDEFGNDYNSFVPKDPSPFKENYEMAGLTTGDPVMLETEDRKFTSAVNVFSPKVVDLLLAIMDAKLSGRQLFVKYPWQKTHQLIADAFRFLPDRNISELTFSTNYTGNGFNAPADLLFINEYYKAQFAGKGLLVDLEATTYQGDEAKAFRNPIEEAMSANDYGKIRKIMAWVLSPDYKSLGNASADTKAVMFIYSQMPEDFKIKMVDEAKNRDELVSALYNHFMSSGNNSKFIEVLTDKVDLCNNLGQIISAIKDLEYYASKGLDVTKVIDDQKNHINDVIMNSEEPDNARQAINVLGLNVVRKYTDNLRDGQERTDLADALFTLWKEKIPSSLQEIGANLKRTKVQNMGLYNLILKNFSTVFNSLYQAFVGDIDSRNKEIANAQLEENLILPLQSEEILKYDSLFQDFALLYHVLSDNDSFINADNFGKVTEHIRKIGLANSKVGQTVKGFIYDYANPRDVKKSVEQLKSIWGLKTNDIINECQKSPMRKEFVKSALEDSGFSIEEVIEILKKNGFRDYKTEFFNDGNIYQALYNSYKRKEFWSGLFGKIAGLFKSKPKDNEAHQDNPPHATHRPHPNPTEHQTNNLGKDNQKTKALSEKDLDNVEKYLRNPNMPVSDVVKENKEEVERRYFEGKRKGKIPPELKRFDPYLGVIVLFFCLSFLGASNIFAASQSRYHDAYGDIKDSPKCYIVKAQTLNARTSPSLYKSKRNNTKRKDNVGFKLSQGDTVFVNALAQPTTVDGVLWLEFTHNNTNYYIDITKLYGIDNPRLQKSINYENDYRPDGFIGWLTMAAPWILLFFTVVAFVFSFFIITPDKESLIGEARDDTGMRPMFMYSLRPYKFFAGLSTRALLAFASSILILLAIGGVIWGLLWVVKLLLWVLIVVGWICLVIGIICLFASPGIGVILSVIGGIIVYKQDEIAAFGNSCVETGMEFFQALNMWDFAYNLIEEYWIYALVISLTPLVLFLIAAIIMMIIAWCLRGYEAFTTHRYNVKHPCPWCHEPSEPAEYYDEDSENGLVALPTNLRPGIYGLFHVTHPITGNKMPTLIANGRDALTRKCHCGHFINFEAGTEKHIGFIGMPASGKTSLLCNVIGLMMKEKTDMHFTNTTDENISEIQNEVDFAKANGHLDYNHLPPKTGANWRASIQCILPRTNGGLPYHIYFNDVAGELFTAGGNDKNLLRFSQDVENIVFIIDPWTMKLNEQKVSDRVKKWLKTEEVELMREGANEEALNAFDSLVNALQSSNRDFSKINLTFAFVKSDTGYLEGVNIIDEDALKLFMKEDFKLGNIIHAAETRFLSVSYIAVNVFQKEDKGVQLLCDKLIQQLEIE